MRRFLFTLMIVLLPLRGWVGDAMAMQMALPGGMGHVAVAAASHGAAQHAHAAAESDHQHGVQGVKAHDCGDHGTDAADNADCPTCTMCQTCHTMAITLPTIGVLGTEPMAALAPPVTESFISADRALGLKPPIA